MFRLLLTRLGLSRFWVPVPLPSVAFLIHYHWGCGLRVRLAVFYIHNFVYDSRAPLANLAVTLYFCPNKTAFSQRRIQA